MYLNPKDGKEPMFRAAVRLLHNHGDSLDPLQVLEVFPILICFIGLYKYIVTIFYINVQGGLLFLK